tara:strand:- start:133 stop:339 length:207 start_codon:yes stop_codon:yes gene_type:complete
VWLDSPFLPLSNVPIYVFVLASVLTIVDDLLEFLVFDGLLAKSLDSLILLKSCLFLVLDILLNDEVCC